jgi:hypothetical protein
LNHDKFEEIDYSVDDFKPQILTMIEKMVGEWKNHKFIEGRPE